MLILESIVSTADVRRYGFSGYELDLIIIIIITSNFSIIFKFAWKSNAVQSWSTLHCSDCSVTITFQTSPAGRKYNHGICCSWSDLERIQTVAVFGAWLIDDPLVSGHESIPFLKWVFRPPRESVSFRSIFVVKPQTSWIEFVDTRTLQIWFGTMNGNTEGWSVGRTDGTWVSAKYGVGTPSLKKNASQHRNIVVIWVLRSHRMIIIIIIDLARRPEFGIFTRDFKIELHNIVQISGAQSGKLMDVMPWIQRCSNSVLLSNAFEAESKRCGTIKEGNNTIKAWEKNGSWLVFPKNVSCQLYEKNRRHWSCTTNSWLSNRWVAYSSWHQPALPKWTALCRRISVYWRVIRGGVLRFTQRDGGGNREFREHPLWNDTEMLLQTIPHCFLVSVNSVRDARHARDYSMTTVS